MKIRFYVLSVDYGRENWFTYLAYVSLLIISCGLFSILILGRWLSIGTYLLINLYKQFVN